MRWAHKTKAPKYPISKVLFCSWSKKYFWLIQCPKSAPANQFDVMCNEWHENNKYTIFRIEVSYNGWYEVSEEFFIEQFNTEALIVKDPITKISEYIKEIKTSQLKFNKQVLNYIENNSIIINEENENAKP